MGYQKVRALTPVKHNGVLRVPGATTGDNAQDFVVDDVTKDRLVALGVVSVVAQSASAPAVLKEIQKLVGLYEGDVLKALRDERGNEVSIGGQIVTVLGSAGVGNTLTAVVSNGWSVTGYQWVRTNGSGSTNIAGATAATYTQTPADVGTDSDPYTISVTVSGITYKATGIPVPGSASASVGGVVVGSAGATGTIYDGYTLSWGDDFDQLDILAPARPRGRWWTTRTYLYGARGSDTLLGTMYDTDPLMTGHNDSNRGVPVGFNNMSLSGSALHLQARKAAASEQAHMSSARNEVAAMIAGPGAINWFPAAAGSGDIIYEARIRFTSASGNPSGWHPTMWLQSLSPVVAVDSDELDWEGSGQAAYLNRNVWTAGAAATATAGSAYAHDGQYHLISFVLNATNVRLYIDGTLYATGAWNANSKSKAQYPLFTSHVYSGTYNGETYSKAAWDADVDGATLSVDHVRVWRRSAANHYKPAATVADISVPYGQSIDIVIPSAATLWGSVPSGEYLQAVYQEENEPGVTHASGYTQFPPGVSYNASTRTLTVNITSGKSGRLNFVMSASSPGSTCEPLRFAVNVGPYVNLSTLQLTNGQVVNFDLYAACDCGVLTSNGASRAKTITVSGLAGSGLSYSDATGMLTGTFAAGSYTMSVTVTNSVGQSTTATVAITTGASYAYQSWTADGVGWFDFSDSSTRTMVGSSCTLIANKRAGMGDLVGAGPYARPITTGGQNGRDFVSLVRDATGTPSRYEAASTTALAQAFQGNDKPYTVLVAYRPTDANTGFIWSASDTIPTTEAQQIALIRRSATASSVRRSLAVATPNDVSWGAGQQANAWRIVAVKHTGTAITIWDTSTTKAVDAVAQDVTAFNTELMFYLGAAESNGGTDPAFATTAAACDYAELIVQSTARTDAEIQQAITDLASKWGITLG